MSSARSKELESIKAIGKLGEDIVFEVEVAGGHLYVLVFREGPMGLEGSFRMHFRSNINAHRLGEVVRAAASAAFPVENPS